LSTEPCRTLVKDFLKSSWKCVETIAAEAVKFEGGRREPVQLFNFLGGRKNDFELDSQHFFLRASVEYSNPQVTVEELQGVIAARLLEVCGNYFCHCGLHEPDEKDIVQICEALKKPATERVVAFLLNTDEIEADRYSMNPLKASIVSSGQSAFPVASVKTRELKIDPEFARKYEGSLICKRDTEQIAKHLETSNDNYMDMVDAVKYEQFTMLSEVLGINLCLPSLRMPLTVLEKENVDDLLHYIIRATHANYHAVERVYRCMGRSMKNLTTLLTVPHSSKGYGSKRAATGKIRFDETRLKNVKVNYRTAALYPNAIDAKDVSIAKAEDHLVVEGEKLANYDFKQVASSPQFFLYALGSPENAALWHGMGAWGASELLKSYTTIRVDGSQGSLIQQLNEKCGVSLKIPLSFNLTPQNMWVHPVHRNIDASVGCVANLNDLVNMGMKMEYLPAEKYVRK
jgi:hypothetical protein